MSKSKFKNKPRSKNSKKTQDKFWSIKAENKDDKTIGHLYLYDLISQYSWWGDEVTPMSFQNDLDSLGDIDLLNIHIFSDGGDVFAGLSIFSKIKQFKTTKNVKVVSYIEGIAASTASFIPMASDEIYISKLADILVHRPMAVLWGMFNIGNLEDIIPDLERCEDKLVNAYLDYVDSDEDTIKSYIIGDDNEGTWFNADEAIEAGFADGYIPEEMDETLGAVACTGPDQYEWNGRMYDLSKYKNAPNLTNNRKEKKNMAKKNQTPQVKNEESTEKYTVTCPKCDHEYEIEVDSDAEETVIETTCPECDHEFKWDIETGEVVEDDTTETDPEGEEREGDGEGTVADSNYDKGVKAERKRIASLKTISKANPAFSDIVDSAIADGSSFEETSKRVFAAMAEGEGNSSTGFRDSQRRETEVSNQIGATPNSGNRNENETEETKAVNDIVAGMGIK